MQVSQGGAQLVEVLNIEKFECPLNGNPQKAKLSDDQVILQMLLPTQLKAPEMAFIDEEDIKDEDQLRSSM